MGFEWGGGACQKIWLQRRGQGKNISGEGGGGSPSQKNSFKFCSDDICDNRELNNGIEDATQKVNSPASKFIALIVTLLIVCQMLALNCKGLYLSSQKDKENRCHVFLSSLKREIRNFHIIWS